MSDNYIGDFKEDQNIKFTFNTRDKSGGAVTYSGGSIKVYKNNAGTGNTSSVTVTKDTPQTGVHRVDLDGSDVFYTPGADYQVHAEGITVDGETVNGTIGEFSIENRSIDKVLDKLPTNYLMGSSDQDDHDTTIDSIDGKVDVVDNNVDAIVAKLPTGDIADESSVNAIQNNTRFSSAPPTPILIPDSGDVVFRISCGLFDTSGSPEDPDTQESVILLAIKARAINGQADKTAFYDDEACTTAATASSTYGTPYVRMVRDSVGRFSTYYKMPSTEDPDNWTFTFKYAENSVEFVRERAIAIVEENPDAVTLADNNSNKDVIVDAIKQRVNITAPATNTIMQDLVDEVDENETKIDGVQTTADDIETKVDAVQTTADNIHDKTEHLPNDPTSETNADSNRDAIITEVNANEAKIDDILDILENGAIDANLVQVNGSSTIDGTQIKFVFELVQAMVNGRFKKDFPVEGQVTFYKRDNSTVLTVIQVTETERTRIS